MFAEKAVGLIVDLRYKTGVQSFWKVVDSLKEVAILCTMCDKYISKELSKGALLSPFHAIPHVAFHCSPLLTRYKDIENRRVIVDLSFDRVNSVNGNTMRDVYEGVDFDLNLPTIDHVVDQILQCRDPVLMKVDISRAFRNIRIDPRDAIKLIILIKCSF